MPLPPSRKDVTGPPPQDVSDLRFLVRHHGSALRQLDPGLQSGRFITPRPVRGIGSQLVGDDSGGDADEIMFENGDRATATTAGSITLALTYEPIEGSLHIRWNGVDQPPTEWSLDGQTVTFVNSHIHVGDVLTAAYAYIDGDEAADGATLILRGSTASYGASDNPGLTGLALPAGTEIGDLIVVSHQGDTGIPAHLTITDPRLTAIGITTHIGFATTLADIAVTAVGGPGSIWSIACVTFQTNAVGWTAAVTSSDTLSNGGLLSVGSVAGVSAAVCAISDAHSVIDGTCNGPTGFSAGGGSSSGKSHARVDYWTTTTAPVDSASPVGTSLFSGGGGPAWATVIGLIGP